MRETNTNNELNFTEVLKIILKHWKILTFTSIIGGVIAFIVCLIVPQKFKSTVTVFPANLGGVSQILTDAKGGGNKDYMAFGEENELEQLQQILHSNEIRDQIASEFQLLDHYKIDTDSKYPKTQLNNKFKKNVSIKKTRFQSIDIEVYDTDPLMAADIANRIADLADTVYKNIQSDRTQEALKIVERELESAKAYVQQIEDSLNKIRLMGINNYRAEAEVYNAAYAEALAAGKNSGLKALEKKIETLSKYGGASLSLLGELELEQKRVSLLKDKLLAAQVNAEQTISIKYIVNKATPSEKKSFPIIWVTVFLSWLLTLVMGMFAVVLTKRTK